MRILYVEDDPMDADLVVRYLHKASPHIEVETSASVAEAFARLERLASEPLDVVLTDVHLPDGDGLSLLREIRRRGLQLAVIVITGLGDEDTAVAALKARADDYVVKRTDYLTRLPLTLESAHYRYQREAFRTSQPLKVLYAEHNAVDADLTLGHLAAHAQHIHLDVVPTGSEALRRITNQKGDTKYDVILLDYHLPGLDALELIKELQTHNLDVPVVLVTGHGSEDVALRALKLGASGYIVKNPGYLYQLSRELEDAHILAELSRREKALLTSQERYKLATTAGGVGVWDWNIDTGDVYVDPILKYLLGYEDHEIHNNIDHWSRLIHPEDAERVISEAQVHIAGETSVYESEHRLVHKDGSTRWFINRGNVVRDDEGIAVRMVGTSTDITSRKMDEEALLESQEHLQRAQQAAKVGTWEWDLESGKSMWSEGIYDILGLQPGNGQASVDAFLKMVHPDDRTRTLSNAEDVIARGGDFYDEFRIIQKDGTIRWVASKGSVVRGSNGRPASMLGANIDITERRLAEEAWHQTEVRNRAMLRAIPDLMFLLSKDGVFLDYHAKDANALYVEPESFLGKSLHDVMPREVSESFDSCVQKTLESNEPVTHEYSLARDGEERFFEWRLVSCEDEKLLCVVRDITEGKRGEQALKRSEERWRGVFENSEVGLVFTDLNGRFLVANTAYQQMLGYTEDELRDMSFVDITHEDDRERNAVLVRELLEGERRGFQLEKRYRCKGGEIIWVNINVSVVPDTYLASPAMMAIVEDITDRKAAEEALRRSELDYSSLVNTIDGVVWEAVVATLQFTFVSERAERLLGYPIEQWLNETNFWPNHVHPDDVAWAVDFCKQATLAKQDHEFKYRMLAADGRIVWLHDFVSVVVENDEPVKLRGIMVDITDHKSAEDALRASEERFRQLAENISVVFFISEGFTENSPGRVLYVSPAYESIFGRSRKSLYDDTRSWLEAVHPDDFERVEAALPDIATGRFDEVFRIVRPNGEMRWVRDRVFPVFGEGGEVYRVAGIVEDITERKRTELMRDGENRALEMIATGAPLEETLVCITSMIESQFDDLICSILLLDHDGVHLRHGAAPNLPAEYVTAIDGISIGPRSGSCGTAMYRREPVIVTDILEDPLWEDYRSIASPHGLRACWSTPILSSQRQVLGSFAMYYRHVASPGPQELRLTEVATRIAGIAIDRKRSQEALRKSEERLRRALEAGKLGTWDWDRRTNAVKWSREHYSILGLAPFSETPTYEGWTGRIHPDDHPQVMAAVEQTIKARSEYRQEYRITREDGSFRWVEARGMPVFDNGDCVAMRGVIVDITERKLAEQAIVQRDQLLEATFNSISSQVIAIDGEGTITHTSRSWEDFAKVDPKAAVCGVGANYLEICRRAAAAGDATSVGILNGIEAVMSGALPSFTIEYPYDTPAETKWLLMQVDPMPSQHGGVVISHTDITARKRTEDSLQQALGQVRELTDQLHAENIYLQEEIMVAHNFGEIIGRSETLKKVLRQAEQVAPLDTTVLVLGETGTGKELLARAMHTLSPRKNRPMVKVNCATLPSELIESELFGHEKGAFTGAHAKRAGRFEIANGGTIFLDEIGELPLDLQAKLLRVLQEGQFERLGSSRTIEVNVRIIAATNRNLEEAVGKGTFRSDLFYRLSIFPISIPPLRDRREDIPILVAHFVKQLHAKLGKEIESIPYETMEALQNYSWPGNIRELRNVIERAAIITQGTRLRLLDSLESHHPIQEAPLPVAPPPPFNNRAETLEESQRSIIIQTLEKTYWRVEGPNGAAALLGVHPNTLRSRFKKLGITRPRFKAGE